MIEKTLGHCGLWHVTRASPAADGFVHAREGHSQSDSDAPWELTVVEEDAIWGEAEGFLDAEAFAPADQWYRQPPDDEARELTYVDEGTFWSEF